MNGEDEKRSASFLSSSEKKKTNERVGVGESGSMAWL